MYLGKFVPSSWFVESKPKELLQWDLFISEFPIGRVSFSDDHPGTIETSVNEVSTDPAPQN